MRSGLGGIPSKYILSIISNVISGAAMVQNFNVFPFLDPNSLANLSRICVKLNSG